MEDSGPQPFKGGHEGNLALIDQDPEKVRKIAEVAYDLGLLIHIDGLPFGKEQPARNVEVHTP